MEEIVLYGAGKRCKNLYKILESSKIKIKAIIDTEADQYTKVVGDIVVQSPDVLKEYMDLPICITVADLKLQQEIRIFIKKKYNQILLNEINYEELILIAYENNVTLKDVIQKNNIRIQKESSVIFDCYNGLGLGGVESWTIDICKALIKRGRKNTYIMSKKGIYDIPSILKEKILYFDFDSSQRYAYETILQAVQLIIDKLPCKVVTCTTDEIMLAAYLVKEYYPDLVEIISVIHSSNERSYKMYEAFKRCSNLYVAVSQDIRQEMIQRGFSEERILTMTCPFPCKKDLQRTYAQKKNEPIRIGYAGRMDGFSEHTKRMDLMLKFIKELGDDGICFYMELAGDGPVRIQMENYIHEQALDDKVVFLGQLNREKMPDFWKRQDVCVNISDFEGRCISTIEAMGNGAVPVVTQVSGTREDIADGVNGYLIPIGDYKTMTDKVEYLAEHRERLLEMGKKAHDVVYPKSLMSEHLKFWEEIINF